MDDEEFFREYRDGLIREAQRFVGSARILRLLDECRQDQLCLAALQQVAPAFFSLTRQAHYVLIVVTCHKLYEDKGERSIPRLLIWLEQNIGIFSADHLRERRDLSEDYWLLEPHRRDPITRATVQAHRDKINRLEFLNSIATRRHKVWAHIDKKYFTDPSRLDQDAPISWSGLDQAVELTNDILSTYSGAFDGLAQPLGEDNAGDLTRLLAKLQNVPSAKLTDGERPKLLIDSDLDE